MIYVRESEKGYVNTEKQHGRYIVKEIMSVFLKYSFLSEQVVQFITI